MDAVAGGIMGLILAAIVPLAAIGLVVYLAVRLAIRDERRNHER
jgi:hypothetical protein